MFVAFAAAMVCAKEGTGPLENEVLKQKIDVELLNF